MKVKYKQPVGILSCSNADFEFDIHLKVTNNDGTGCVFYEPICALKFVENNFLGRAVARAPISGFFCLSVRLSELAYCLNDQAHFA